MNFMKMPLFLVISFFCFSPSIFADAGSKLDERLRSFGNDIARQEEEIQVLANELTDFFLEEVTKKIDETNSISLKIGSSDLGIWSEKFVNVTDINNKSALYQKFFNAKKEGQYYDYFFYFVQIKKIRSFIIKTNMSVVVPDYNTQNFFAYTSAVILNTFINKLEDHDALVKIKREYSNMLHPHYHFDSLELQF